jgi:hypothetical protein
VYKDHLATGRQNYVRSARQVAAVQPKAITHRMERAANNQLWFRVDFAHSRHPPPDILRNVGELCCPAQNGSSADVERLALAQSGSCKFNGFRHCLHTLRAREVSRKRVSSE